MGTIRTNLIVTGLPENEMDWNKVADFAEIMLANDIDTGDWGFPPIEGFFGEISEKEIGQFFNAGYVEDMVEITEKDIGTEVFFVTDGHHRAFGAQRAKIWAVDYELDNSGFVYHGERHEQL